VGISRRGASTQFRNFGDFDAAYGGWNLDGEPYTHKDGTKFDWFRSRMLGGRTNHWEGFHSVSVQKILSTKVLMASVTIGQSVMMMWRPIMIKSIG